MKHKLTRLTETERRFAEENHNLIYSFLHRYGHSVEEYYNVAVFGYLKAVQVYSVKTDLQERYDFPYVCWQYMRAEIGNYLRMKNSHKRKPTEIILSLDVEHLERENLYNTFGGKSAEDDVMEKELLAYVLKSLTGIQKKIVQYKIDGFSNKEVYLALEIKPSTYYKEMQRMKATVEQLLT